MKSQNASVTSQMPQVARDNAIYWGVNFLRCIWSYCQVGSIKRLSEWVEGEEEVFSKKVKVLVSVKSLWEADVAAYEKYSLEWILEVAGSFVSWFKMI